MVDPNKPFYDVTFTRRFLRGEQMTACEQTRVRAVVVDSGLHTEDNKALECLSTYGLCNEKIAVSAPAVGNEKHQYRPSSTL